MHTGKIIAYSIDAGGGVIHCEDRKFFFLTNQWLSSDTPVKDLAVTFVANGSSATSVKPLAA